MSRGDAANHARAKAALEIECLEREGEQTAEALAAVQKATQDALPRAERADATAQAVEAEAKRAAAEHQASAVASRKEIDPLQKQPGKTEASVGAMQAELQKAQPPIAPRTTSGGCGMRRPNSAGN